MATVTLHRPSEPTDLPLVLLAPFPLDARVWARVAEQLGGDVVTVIPPGFGDEAETDDEPSMDGYARAVLAALDFLGIDRFVVAGNSMGGYAALALAALAPDRVAGIGMVGSKAAADDDEARAKRISIAEKAEAGEPAAEVVGDMSETMISSQTRQEKPTVAADLQLWLDNAPLRGIAWAQRAMAARPDRLDVLRAFTGAGLVLRGTEDPLMDADSQRAMAEALGVEAQELPGVGHLVPLENPGATVDALRKLWDASR